MTIRSPEIWPSSMLPLAASPFRVLGFNIRQRKSKPLREFLQSPLIFLIEFRRLLKSKLQVFELFKEILLQRRKNMRDTYKMSYSRWRVGRWREVGGDWKAVPMPSIQLMITNVLFKVFTLNACDTPEDL